MKKKEIKVQSLELAALFAGSKQFVFAAMISVFMLSSCAKEDDPQPQPVETKDYIYVLSEGDYKSNNSSLTLYNVEDSTATTDYFLTQNGRGLGNTAQDIIVYGSKIYISVYGEKRIEVTDLDAKIIKTIETGNHQPRYLTSYGGKVYATYFDGFVARIDTASYAVETTPVGRNPEQMAVANGKLYVANSGGMDYASELGYDKTVSVIDLSQFKEIKKIPVEINPRNMIVDNQNNVYVISIGDYVLTPNTIQKINSSTDAVTKLDIQASYFTLLGSKLYLLYSEYDENWQPTITYKSYDIQSNTILSDNFIGNVTFSADGYQISSDSESGELYIMVSDNINNGDVYIFDKDLKLKTGFEAGLNPNKAIRIRK
ncbi:MAG: hypothetical protein LBD53_07045 [Tannerella sp.]|jgi:hypothetical protein|nr:hypothetical protein [Tannerella sp.]